MRIVRRPDGGRRLPLRARGSGRPRDRRRPGSRRHRAAAAASRATFLSRYLPASTCSASRAWPNASTSARRWTLSCSWTSTGATPRTQGSMPRIDRIGARLEASGFAARAAAPADGPSVWVEEFGRAQGWDYTRRHADARWPTWRSPKRCCSRASSTAWRCASTRSRRRPAASLRRSWTSARGRPPPTTTGKDIRGAVVLGDAGAGRLWQMAVVQRGAIGVVSTAMEDYIRPGPPDVARGREAERRVGRPAVGQRAVRRDAARVRLQGHAARGRADQGAPRGRARRA